jgi:tRNA dimethylallyltransferase
VNFLPKILVVLGPTASGKSDLAVKLAIERNGEIVSADSRQVYRGLDIGSGKITPEETKGVPHHLLDVASPRKVFSASDYAELARQAIGDILSRGKLPVICGGTGFYIDAVLYGDSFAPVPPNPEIRKKTGKTRDGRIGGRLSELDPERFSSIDVKNGVRLIRALEIVLSTGSPSRKQKRRLYMTAKKIGILWPMEKLDKRIELRLDKRLSSGMIEEVADLKFPKRKGLS